jgi:hypothetical protein
LRFAAVAVAASTRGRDRRRSTDCAFAATGGRRQITGNTLVPSSPTDGIQYSEQPMREKFRFADEGSLDDFHT